MKTYLPFIPALKDAVPVTVTVAVIACLIYFFTTLEKKIVYIFFHVSEEGLEPTRYKINKT